MSYIDKSTQMSSYNDRFARARQALAIADVQPGRKLGITQRSVLRALVEHNVYSAGSGWVWDTHLGTVKVLESLVRRGLVERTESVRTVPIYRPAAFLLEPVSA